jgi:hypothetical protein
MPGQGLKTALLAGALSGLLLGEPARRAPAVRRRGHFANRSPSTDVPRRRQRAH